MPDNSRIKLQQDIVRDLGHPMAPGSSVLDLGCGNGDAVHALRQAGIDARGCDFAFKEGEHVQHLIEERVIALIEPGGYRLPFEDASFDLVLSDQVFEHVADYPGTLMEISRVTKPGGIGLHIFPSRYNPMEPHVQVPLATVIQHRWWLRIWAALGIRTELQQGWETSRVVKWNHDYLTSSTHYLTKAEIESHFRRFFEEVAFCEHLFLKNNRRTRKIHEHTRGLPWIASLYRTLKARVLFTRKALD